MRRSVILVASLVLTTGLGAQPIRDNAGLLEVETPVRAIIELDGSATLETEWVGLPKGEPASAVIPKEVDIVERQTDGTVRAGILYRNAEPGPVPWILRTVPMLVSFDGARWEVSTDTMSIRMSHGTYPPGFERNLRQTVFVEVPDSPARADGPDARVFQVTYVPDEAQFQNAFGNDPQLLADMNDTLDIGKANGRYFAREDPRALDTVGWLLEPNDVDLPDPKAVEKGDPPPMAYLTTTTPTFTWTDSVHSKWHVTVFEGDQPDPANTVLAPRDLVVQGYSVPASSPLQDATRYSWLIVAEVIAGMAYSDVRTFIVCRADCDQAGSPGTLDVFDFVCFQDKFVASDPYACDFDTSTGMVCATSSISLRSRMRS